MHDALTALLDDFRRARGVRENLPADRGASAEFDEKTAMTIWRNVKDAAIRAGLEPWLRPIADKVRGREPDEDDEAAFALIAGLAKDAVCVDIGCHKGKFLDPMRRAAPNGRFFAFEPIPYLYDLLKAKYSRDARVQVHCCALSSADGAAAFYVNERDMGLSGLDRRPQRMGQDRLTKIGAVLRTLDGVLGDQRVDFIKIDVEGAEFDVLKGARRTMERSRPLVLFEFGLGGAEYFSVDAAKMYAFFESLRYRIYRVPDFVGKGEALSGPEFNACFEQNIAYNFVASPRA